MPVLGKAAVELFQYIITPPLDRRLTEWRNEIAEGLRRLEANRGLDFDALGSNPQFIDAVLSATLVATRTSQSGKLEALRNAVLNSALPIALDVTRQQVFLAMVDRFTDTHLAILRYFQGPEHWHAANQKPLPSLRLAVAADLLGEAFPELKPHKDLTINCGRNFMSPDS